MKVFLTVCALLSSAVAQYLEPLSAILQPEPIPAHLYAIRGPVYVEPSSLQSPYMQPGVAVGPPIIGPPVPSYGPPILGPPVWDQPPMMQPNVVGPPSMVGPPIIGPPVMSQAYGSPSPYNPYSPAYPVQMMYDEQQDEVSPAKRRFNTNVQSGIQQIGQGNMNLQGNIQQVNRRAQAEQQLQADHLEDEITSRHPLQGIARTYTGDQSLNDPLADQMQAWGRGQNQNDQMQAWGRGQNQNDQMQAWGRGQNQNDQMQAWGRGQNQNDQMQAWGRGENQNDQLQAWGRGQNQNDQMQDWARGQNQNDQLQAWGRGQAQNDQLQAWGRGQAQNDQRQLLGRGQLQENQLQNLGRSQAQPGQAIARTIIPVAAAGSLYGRQGSARRVPTQQRQAYLNDAMSHAYANDVPLNAYSRAQQNAALRDAMRSSKGYAADTPLFDETSLLNDSPNMMNDAIAISRLQDALSDELADDSSNSVVLGK